MRKKNSFSKFITVAVMVVVILCAAPVMEHFGIDMGVSAFALDATGQCGENVYWNFDSSTGKLTISGSGPMYDYGWLFNSSPFYYAREEIKNVEIKNGITTIGEYVFWQCTAIENVAFGKDVKTIKSNSFSSCSRVKELTFPNSLTEICTDAFNGCKVLKTINLNEGLKIIGTNAFFGCSALQTVKIPDTVTSLGESAFCACYSLTSVTFGKALTVIPYNCFHDCSALMNVVIPENIVEVKDYAFDALSDTITFMNPNCKIYDNYGTIGSTAIIYGYSGSTAEAYAKANNRTFKKIQAHTHVYTTKTTEASTTQYGKIEHLCVSCGYVIGIELISKISTVKLSETSYTYNGKVKTPTVIVKDSSGKTLEKDTDYTVKYSSGRKAVGTYNVKVTFKGNYSGSKTLSFKIVLGQVTGVKCDYSKGLKISWNKVTGATGYEVYLYNANNKVWQKVASSTGTAIQNNSVSLRQKVKVRAYYKASDGTIYYGEFSDSNTETENCEHTYKTVTTKATTSKNGKIEKSCTKCGDVKSSKTIYKISSVTLSKTKYAYDKNEKKPGVTVKDSKGNKLKNKTDYKVEYLGKRTAVGTYKVKVTFKGNYSGSKTLKFQIVIGQVKNLVQNDNQKGLAVSWSKVTGATGYQVYEHNVDANVKHYINNKSRSDGLWTVTSLHNSSAKGTYKWKVRAVYVDKNGKAHYGAWSTVEEFTGIE